MKKRFELIALLGAAALVGCAKDSALQSNDVPVLYEPVSISGNTDSCEALAEQVAALDSGLGDEAIEEAPPVPASAGARWADFGKNLIGQTLIGPLQPVIQSVKAATNYNDKTRVATETEQRAEVRRAYLLGNMQGAGCTQS